MKKIVVAVSGASGTVLSHALLKTLASEAVQSMGDIAVHLIVSHGAQQVFSYENTSFHLDDLLKFAHFVHGAEDFSAPMASGSWRHDGMIICPCSMASLAAIATGNGRNLIHRSADVCLKERLPLVIVPRETPLSQIHLRNMLALSEAGATVMPPAPAYYAGLHTLDEHARHFAGRILDQLGLPAPDITRWGEPLHE